MNAATACIDLALSGQVPACDLPIAVDAAEESDDPRFEQVMMKLICATPDDDGPRLRLAHWLETHGDKERAEFVRVQIELAKRQREPNRLTGMERVGRNFAEHTEVAMIRAFADDKRPCDCEMCLERRERELLDAYKSTWLLREAQVDCTFDSTSSCERIMEGFRFVRGFAEELTCTADDFLQHADALRAATPLRRVKLTTPLRFDVNTYNHQQWGIRGDPKSSWFSDDEIANATLQGDTFSRILLRLRFPGIEFELPDFGDGM